MNEKAARKMAKFYNRSLTRALRSLIKLPFRLRVRWAWAILTKKRSL
jgi:hypothetical protein